MDISTLLPLLLTGASTGLTCGLRCGACGNPMVNVFFAGYLFTHSNRMKKSLVAFFEYHMGRAVTVSVLCMLISWFGGQMVNEQGEFFGINLSFVVNVIMLFFVIGFVIRWFGDGRRNHKHSCSEGCEKKKRTKNRFCSMFLYGVITGISPCASLMLVLSYAASLHMGEAILVGVSFSLANSLIPLLLLTILTGLLSEQMHKEIPEKIRYFQLVIYLLFACVLIKNLI